MLLEEMQRRVKSSEITLEQLEKVHEIYCLLDFDKDDFCKLVDAIGIDKWTAKAPKWERLVKAENDLRAKERYEEAIVRIVELDRERDNLREIINDYKS